ncbi:MAG: insulinase family protein [Proteobacteria bacterium]|nr:insulinase family protein [Pseudomonadota bacterium]
MRRHPLVALLLVYTLVIELLAPASAAPVAPPAPSASSGATSLPKGVRFVTTVEGISEYRLDNGLRVLLIPDDSVQNVTVNITYLVGSRHERYGETGMAHLLEHMLFKGSRRHPHIPDELSEHGAHSNATTWLDRTNYFETVEATEANLRWALEMEADRMVTSFVAKADLDKEMTVVRNEFESGENSPGDIMVERALETAFLWHNYGHPTIGARSDIENVPIENLQQFYRTWYQPDNAVLAVAGRFDVAFALRTVAESFGPIPRPSRVLPAIYTREPAQDGEREIVLRRVGESQDLATLYHVPAGSHVDFAPIDVFMQLMAEAPTGRLYKALVDARKATSVGGYTYQLHDPGVAIFSAEMRAGAPMEPARAALLETVEEGVRKAPVTPDEVERAKSNLLKHLELSLNNTEHVGKDLSEWQAMGDWRLLFLYRDNLRKVTAADVQRVATQYFRPSNRTLAQFIPTKAPERVEIPESPDVRKLVEGYKGEAAVVAGEKFDASPENIEKHLTRVRTPGGIKLALLPKKTRGRAVHVNLTLHFGTLAALKGKETIGELTAAMLLRGTRKHTRQQLKDSFDRLKARVSVGGDATSVTISIETLRDNLADVLRLVAEVLRDPSFPPDELEQMRQEELVGLEQSKTDPQALASNLLSRHLNPYPAGDPRHVSTPDEELAELAHVQVADLAAFHAAFYGASDGSGAAVGDFEAPAFTKLVEEVLGGWKSPSAYARIPSELFAVSPLEKVIETPDKENAVYLAGLKTAMSSADPDYGALILGNYVLGGGFLNSRLATRLRQELGVSYGVGSSFSAEPLDKVARFGVYAIYAPQNADKVRQNVRAVLEKAFKDGFTEKEIEAARNGLLQSRQVERAKDSSLVSRLAAYEHVGRTMKWDETLERSMRSLTAAQVLAAMRRYIDLTQLNVVTAGDFQGKKKGR